MPLHIGKGRDVSTAISDIIDYVENPQKTDNGRLIYGYECDTRTADAEFLLSKRQYINLTGRQRGTDDVIAYHLRQSFMPGEITPEKSNEIGRELALKLTKGNNSLDGEDALKLSQAADRRGYRKGGSSDFHMGLRACWAE